MEPWKLRRRSPVAVLVALGWAASACSPASTAQGEGSRSNPVPPSAAGPEPERGGASVLSGRELGLHSNGEAVGAAWQLDASGFVGAYLQLDQEGPVSVRVDASAASAATPAPLALVVADEERDFVAGPVRASHGLETSLPPGTYLVRIDFKAGAPRGGQGLVVHRLAVDGARLLPQHTDQNALDAANTYIHHYRRGRARLELVGVPPGSLVKVSLQRHTFGFGANIPYGENVLIPEVTPEGSNAELFQRLLLAHFNTVVLSNGGKWVYQEPVRDKVQLDYVDRFLDFAEQHGLWARMHNLLWDTEQQPSYIASRDDRAPGLLTRAHAGDVQAKRELLEEIDERIDYYVRERARRYVDLDVLNESQHRARYYEVLGDSGVAELFQRVARAVKAGGASTRLYLNEYNLLQWSSDPLAPNSGPDPYANWYRWHAEAIIRAGGPVDGLGVEYYADGRLPSEIGQDAHSAARIMGVLQNLAGTGSRLTLSEFAVNAGQLPPERGADVLEETLRLVFGTRGADAFVMWGTWGLAAQKPAPLSILVDADNELTPAGRRYESLLEEWSTALALPVAADGSIEFVGFYGDYAIDVAGQTRCFTLTKGHTQYSLPPTLPPSVKATAVAAPGAIRTPLCPRKRPG
jgi:GH35 family endo-1,4-beta-xylanase